MSAKVEMSGFSGAPLVNTKGEVVGILTGSADLDGKNYVVATPIREIQKIKF
jgi:S1-C subfamily serine protease